MSASGLVKRIAARAARFVRLYATDPAYRRVAHLRLRSPRTLFQPFGATRRDRYPRLFRAVAAALEGRADLRLLSFGCSTGEEVATLHGYFPGAHIKGIDINAQSIAICRARSPGMDFTVADSTQHEAPQSYDAIFCLAVLRHGALARDAATRSDPRLRFADFERAVADFARCLKPGGLLALRHGNFRFEDTATAAGFEVLLDARRLRAAPKFGPDNRRLPDTPREAVLFRKRHPGHGQNESDSAPP